jgi:TATA-binding protein-associated factor
VFDFLMPNFLGSSKAFATEFARPITKSQLPGASPEDICHGMEQLKILHQQVLPFILRREKEHVLKELPPKIITTIPCDMSDVQRKIYNEFCNGPQAKKCLEALQSVLHKDIHASDQQQQQQQQHGENHVSRLGADTLKSLLFLRLVCTHPSLAVSSMQSSVPPSSSMRNDGIMGPARNKQSGQQDNEDSLDRLESSGKLLALAELLRSCGILSSGLMAADNDASLIYCQNTGEDDDDDNQRDELYDVFNSSSATTENQGSSTTTSPSKCLIFAQFTHSLDVVEKLVLSRYLPSSSRYLRLDGRVPEDKRADVVDEFNQEESVRILLLTTRIGGLGLNLTGTKGTVQVLLVLFSCLVGTDFFLASSPIRCASIFVRLPSGADTVIFLEHDWNPHADLQSMDRAHRIGQTKTVNVYKLVTTDSVEEKIMKLQDIKLAMSQAIVNTDNSTLFSMGTDRLLDIFSVRSSSNHPSKSTSTSCTARGFAIDDEEEEANLDALVERYADDYVSLSVDDFLRGFQLPTSPVQQDPKEEEPIVKPT